MKLICLQAGHAGLTSGAIGAPGEQEFNVRITNRLKEILTAKGFDVQTVNANPTDNEISKDFDLFLAIHYDANIYGTGGGFVDFPDPSIDFAHTESKRIKEAIESEYFNHSGIVNMPNRSNANTKFYYMWSRLTANTPCNIIECGVGKDAHDSVILADTERVCNALTRGICKAFSVPFDAESDNQAIIDQLRTERDNNWNLYQGQVEENKKLSVRVQELEGQVNELNVSKTKLQEDLVVVKNNLISCESSLKKLHEEDLFAVEESLEAQHKAEILYKEKNEVRIELGLVEEATHQDIVEQIRRIVKEKTVHDKEYLKLVKQLESLERKTKKNLTFWQKLIKKLKK